MFLTQRWRCRTSQCIYSPNNFEDIRETNNYEPNDLVDIVNVFTKLASVWTKPVGQKCDNANTLATTPLIWLNCK